MSIKFELSQNDRKYAHTEAAIYAEGTPYTSDELFAAWVSECEAAQQIVSCQRVYEYVLRQHPEFVEGWL